MVDGRCVMLSLPLHRLRYATSPKEVNTIDDTVRRPVDVVALRFGLPTLRAWIRFCEYFLHVNPLTPELNPVCCLLALLGAHHFLHVSRIKVKSLTLRLLMSYIYGAPILDVSRSHITTQHSR